MVNDSSLMAHLVPRLTRQVENAATEALAYILKRSDGTMQALNDLLREGGFDIEPVVRVRTQVTFPDGSLPDMAGYDKSNRLRLVVEAKFWHALSEDQTVGYGQLLDQPGPATLLLIAPEPRLPTLWAEIHRQMEQHSRLEPIESHTGMRRAKVLWTEPRDTELNLLLVSWVRLLDMIETSSEEDGVKSDIRQLRGLAQSLGDKGFLPIRSEEMSPSLARRLVWYNQLVDDVVDSRGVPDNWMDIKGVRAQSQRFGYGRYFNFPSISRSSYFWFGVNHERWAGSGDTPLWLNVGGLTDVNMDEIGRQLNVQFQDDWLPIHLKTGVEYDEVLDDVVSQLKKIDGIVRALLPSEQSPTETGSGN